MTVWLELPSDEEREALIESLKELIAHDGPADFLHRPLLLPTPAHFPDAYRPDFDGAVPMLTRMLALVRLSELPFVLYPERQDLGTATINGTRHHGAIAWYAGFFDGSLHFGLDESALTEPEKLAGTLLHECAHAWRDAHGLVSDDGLIEEQLTDLTAIFLGGGVFVANNTYRYRADAMATMSEQVGYVAPNVASFALAVMVRARSSDDEETIAAALESIQRRLFRQSLASLPSALELRAQLGLPETAPPAMPFQLPPVVTSLPEPSPDEVHDPEAPPVSRSRHTRIGNAALFGVLATLGVLIVMGALGRHVDYRYCLLGLAAAPLGRHWYAYRCTVTDCGCPVGRTETRCPVCHTRLENVPPV